MSFIRPKWALPNTVQAVSSTRTGGFSTGDFASLNLGMHVSDDPELVQRNRQHLQQVSNMPSAAIWMNQTHSTVVASVDSPSISAIESDALVTSTPGVVLSVMTADCLPVLFASKNGQQVAATHAGWRGLVGGILENTLECFAQDVTAWIGPAIGVEAFEVGEEVRQQFVDIEPSDAIAFIQHKPGKFMADLPLLAKLRLTRMGCKDVALSNLCTYSNPETFFSYRRQSNTGRQASFIWITD
ncbi:peptidoglycan editing factor PgeF [Vibrio gallicus]|uniref:peptidoglycan editing factor PgeF n=1 Tax=Vibrio gallicus TaxID=190897 RepID=UPI0021C42ECC|nr:peptidoglycan editing factor PgeF [Vibrio gallicus]